MEPSPHLEDCEGGGWGLGKIKGGWWLGERSQGRRIGEGWLGLNCEENGGDGFKTSRGYYGDSGGWRVICS